MSPIIEDAVLEPASPILCVVKAMRLVNPHLLYVLERRCGWAIRISFSLSYRRYCSSLSPSPAFSKPRPPPLSVSWSVALVFLCAGRCHTSSPPCSSSAWRALLPAHLHLACCWHGKRSCPCACASLVASVASAPACACASLSESSAATRPGPSMF
jgi:hypothetical protein